MKLNVNKLFLLIMMIVAFATARPGFAAESLRVQKVTANVFAIVGESGNRSPENLGNNATFGVVITSEGIVLIDSGGTYQGAAEIHNLIRQIADRPVIAVINTGGQDHRWLGNGYFKALGARLIASNRAVQDQKARLQDQFNRLAGLVGAAGVSGTDAVYATETFDNALKLSIGGVEFELFHAGQAHTPGDSFVWLPEEDVMFTGDIVYTRRMLGIGEQSNSRSWIDVYQSMAAYNPGHIVPGHGEATDLARANADTYEYLRFLRASVSEFIEAGGDITDIREIDQSKFDYLLNFENLAGRNAQKVFTELEWE